MEKFTKFQKANLKRYAQIVEPLISKRNKALAKIENLKKEVEDYQEQINLTDTLVKSITGGYGIESIIKKVVTPTDKLDKNGNVIKVTTFEFIHPDTIIPPVEELIVPPTVEEGTPGSDFDADKENFYSNENFNN